MRHLLLPVVRAFLRSNMERKMRTDCSISLIIDCSLKKEDDGSYSLDTIYEIQQLESSAVSVRTRYFPGKGSDDLREVTKSLGLNPADLIKGDHRHCTGLFEDKLFLRKWMQDNKNISHLNPFFVPVTPKKLHEALQSNDKLELRDELFKFYQKLAPETQIVLKSARGTRGETNHFLNLGKTFDEFQSAILALIKTENLITIESEYVLEQCRNASMTHDGKTYTYRIALGAYTDEKNKLVSSLGIKVLWQSQNDGFNSHHGVLKKTAFVDERIFDCSDRYYSSQRKLTEEEMALGIAIENSTSLQKTLNDLASQLVTDSTPKPFDYEGFFGPIINRFGYYPLQSTTENDGTLAQTILIFIHFILRKRNYPNNPFLNNDFSWFTHNNLYERHCDVALKNNIIVEQMNILSKTNTNGNPLLKQEDPAQFSKYFTEVVRTCIYWALKNGDRDILEDVTKFINNEIEMGKNQSPFMVIKKIFFMQYIQTRIKMTSWQECALN